MAPTTSRRRSFRFSLRTLFALVVVIAIPLAWVAKERQQSRFEQRVADELEKQGFKGIIFGGPYDLWERERFRTPQGWWRNLARRVLGKRIIVVDLGGELASELFAADDGSPSREELYLGWSLICDLTPLSGLTNVQWITAPFTQVSDLTPIAGLTSLYGLNFNSTPVSDLAPLAGLKNLQMLELRSTPVRDLTPLAGLKNLQLIYLSTTQASDLTPLSGLTELGFIDVLRSPVSKEQVEALEKSLPNCKINHLPFP